MAATYQIREIEITDNLEIKSVIQNLFIEMNLPLVGTAYSDPELNDMFAVYNDNRSIYYVVSDGCKVFGGGGIRQLEGEDETYCELQKLYFSPQIRGLGFGKQVIKACLDFALTAGYQHCYIESKAELHAAIHLFRENGFMPIDAPIGNTGHHACEVQMLKSLL